MAPNVLLVVRDPALRLALRDGMTALGCAVLATSDTSEALARFLSGGAEVIVWDDALTGRNGAALLRAALRVRPARLLLLVDPGDSVEPDLLGSVSCVLTKPFDPDDLVAQLNG